MNGPLSEVIIILNHIIQVDLCVYSGVASQYPLMSQVGFSIVQYGLIHAHRTVYYYSMVHFSPHTLGYLEFEVLAFNPRYYGC